MYQILSARYRTETEVWRDQELDINPLVIEATPRVELLGVDSRFKGQGVGRALMRAAEEYCLTKHKEKIPPWSEVYVSSIVAEGFGADDLIIGLDTSWIGHTVSAYPARTTKWGRR